MLDGGVSQVKQGRPGASGSRTDSKPLRGADFFVDVDDVPSRGRVKPDPRAQLPGLVGHLCPLFEGERGVILAIGVRPAESPAIRVGLSRAATEAHAPVHGFRQNRVSRKVLDTVATRLVGAL